MGFVQERRLDVLLRCMLNRLLSVNSSEGIAMYLQVIRYAAMGPHIRLCCKDRIIERDVNPACKQVQSM
jgi:hypothetical protein